MMNDVYAELELLHTKVANMSASEFEDWLNGQITSDADEAYEARLSDGYVEGYAEGHEAASEEYE